MLQEIFGKLVGECVLKLMCAIKEQKRSPVLLLRAKLFAADYLCFSTFNL